MVNLPNRTKTALTKIIGVVTEPIPFVKYSKSSLTFSVEIYKDDPTETSKYLICTIDAATSQGIANQIANCYTESSGHQVLNKADVMCGKL